MAAANDQLPRGAFLSSSTGGATGAQALCTYPAIPNVAWALTSILARLISFTGFAGGAFTPFIVVNGVQYGIVAVGSVGVADEWSLAGEVVFPPNTAVQVAFSVVASAGTVEILNTTAEPRYATS